MNSSSLEYLMSMLDSDILEVDLNLSTRPIIHLPRAIPRAAFAACLVLSQSMFIAGCSDDSAAPADASTTPAVAPAISSQPSGQSVPMGLPATYAVTATGTSLQFQWKRNGAPIVGANASNYTTPATVFADSGASFSVTVSNSTGTADSAVAALTVTARAPMAGDLRFQQVDAPSTVNGWGNAAGLATDLPGGFFTSYSQSIGTPFYVGLTGNCVVPPSTDGVGCAWFYSANPAAAYSGSASLSVSYVSDSYANLQADLQSSAWPGLQSAGTSLTPSSDGSVITSLDLESADALFALSWIQSTQESGFLPNQVTVAPANVQAAAVQEGAAGRVITAISYDAGQVTCLSYGWQADAGTLYEAQVATSSAPNAVAAAASLAAQGYIITASGRADDDGNLLLVGTRVQGDTMARPFMAAQGADILAYMQQGYSIVAVISDITQPNATTFILER
jgi:hypothetical protein